MDCTVAYELEIYDKNVEKCLLDLTRVRGKI